MNFTYVALVLSLFAVAVAEADQKAQAESMALASRTLQVDGINGSKVVEILEAETPFVFTYCRPGSPALWKHEVISLDAPDKPIAATKVTKDMAVENDSEHCRAEG